MAAPSIQGHKLKITVVGCNQLKDTWYGRHKPYVQLIYGTDYHRTKTSEDGGKNPSFNEKFEFSLIDGVLELKVHVLSTHQIMDSFVGHGKVNLDELVRRGSNVATTVVPLESMTGKKAGEVNLTLEYYPNSNVSPQQAENSSYYTHTVQQHQQPPDYMKQELHNARMRMMNAQIQRASESIDRMNGIDTTGRWTTVRYTNSYEDSMNTLGRIG